MKRTAEIPNPIPAGICEKHGSFDFLYTPFGDAFFVADYCRTCVDEKKVEEERIEAENNAIKKAEHERSVRESKRKKAGISKRNLYKSFNDYICKNEGQQKAKNDCQRYVKEFPTDKSLIMSGSVGTGKTLLACAMLEDLVDNHRCCMMKVIEIIRGIKSTWKKDSEGDEQDAIDWYVGLDLLIIDEVGIQFGSDTEKLFIFDIIDGRYEQMRPTILISNLDINGIKESIGERCVDRLREGGGSMIAFNWESQRG